ncbi:MAG: acylphosphatase [Chthoniobacterales bacterium]
MNTRLIRYEGRVQGVGFRASVLALARGYEITGYVKNLSDGRVELVARGETKEIEDFFTAIRESHLASHIQYEEEVYVDAKLLTPLLGFKIV